MIGKKLGHYCIVESLGKGGMGEVYAAEDEKLNRNVALKILPPEFSDQEERRQRFQREAKVVAALNHPNIVTIYSVEHTDQLHFFTMELIDGVPLSEKIPAGGLSPKTFFELAIPLVDALSAAHKSGVTHRDLKPANVMITSENRVKVLDFGLAKLLENQVEADGATAVGPDDLTQVGRVLGTAAYMSPEQAEGKLVDQRSDVFSLGILLYQMLTGKKPFHGDTQVSMMSSVIKDDPPSISDLKPDISPQLIKGIQRCLEKDSSKRYQSADELLDALQRAKQEFDTGELMASQSDLSSIGAIVKAPYIRKTFFPALIFLLISVPVLVYFWLSSGEQNTDGFSVDKRSIAVFNFENLSGSDELDWLRSGLTEMLVTDLSQIPNLKVLSTERLRQILGKDRLSKIQEVSFSTVQEVARSSGVGTAVLGSYLKVGDKMRINLRLQNTTDGETIDSQSFEGEGESSIFNMVDEVTRTIRHSLEFASLQEEQTDRDLSSVTTDSVEAYKLYVEGIQLHDSGADREAILPLEKAVELDPDFAMAQAKLSVAYGNTGDWEKGKEFAEKALQHLDRLTDRERYYIEGRFYSLNPDTRDRAVVSYQKAIDLFPDHDAARNNLALIFIEQEHYELAIEHLEELRNTGMVFPGTYSTLAGAYASIGEPEKGLEVLEEYVERFPANASGYDNLGKALVVAGQLEKAAEAFEQSESLAPNPMPFDRIGTLMLLGRWDEAKGLAEKVMNLGQQHPFSWAGSAYDAVIELYFGRSDDAIEILEKTVAQHQGNPLADQVKDILAGVTFQVGRIEDALAYAEENLKNTEDADRRISNLTVAAIASVALRKPEKSKKYRDEMLGLLVDRPEETRLRTPLVLDGSLALASENYATAISKLEEAVSLLPETPTNNNEFTIVWSGLAEAYWETGDKDKAYDWYLRLAEAKLERLFSPVVYVQSYYFLGKYHHERGETEKAQEYLQIFLEFWKDGQLHPEYVAEAKRLTQ